MSRGSATGALAAFRIPHFPTLWVSNLLHFFAAQVARIALQWLVTELTPSRSLIGTVGLVQGLATLAASPLGGVAADRLPKRRLLILGRVCLALVPGALALLILGERVEVWHVIAASGLGGIIIAISQPAAQTYVFDVVGRQRVQNAVALNATGTGAAEMGGPALAGVLIAWVGLAASFGLGTAGLVLAAGLLWWIPVPGLSSPDGASSPWRDLREGFRYAMGHPPVRLALIICSLSLFNGAASVMRPVFARHVLDVGSQGFGLMAGAAGVGTVLGGILAATLPPMRRPGVWMAVTMLVFALGIAAYSLAFSFEYVLAVELLMGFSGQLWGVATYSGLQMAVPEEMRGRVMSMVFMALQGGLLGQLAIGALADGIGDQGAMAVFGIVPSLILTGILIFGYRTLREL